jgi:hypothetical protein
VQKARMSSETYLGHELKPPHAVPESRMLAFRLPSVINGKQVYPGEPKT